MTLGRIFFAIALVLFVLVAIGAEIAKVSLLPLGLASLAAGLLVEK